MSADKSCFWMACYDTKLGFQGLNEWRIVFSVDGPIGLGVQLDPALIVLVPGPQKRDRI